MSKQSFLILHGLGGSGPDHWQTWLANELAERNHHVIYPVFPNVDSPDKQVWIEELSTVMKTIPENQPLTVITHSLGCLLWLHFTSIQNNRIAEHVIMVAPPSPQNVIEAANSFFPVPLKNNNLTRTADETLFVHSSNDPYCSLTDAKYYMNIGVPSIVFPNMGHINVESGHGRWDWILEKCLFKDHMKKRVI
ncbi:alpha/beta fold hydrolase [Bacillus sp. BRMEA1]|uniref:RBBP9/YdeN family alpha/beta hydrolase n=1 Tax=Neobacillus endophyticus TaxID=2738405 RepID=UPI001564AA05|nr:alpha/beta fold hydrolase [Neobacillus endophyticus]NRD76255.1 alpha/beta fold hydrolase [Neobacillus endophyticus]